MRRAPGPRSAPRPAASSTVTAKVVALSRFSSRGTTTRSSGFSTRADRGRVALGVEQPQLVDLSGRRLGEAIRNEVGIASRLDDPAGPSAPGHREGRVGVRDGPERVLAFGELRIEVQTPGSEADCQRQGHGRDSQRHRLHSPPWPARFGIGGRRRRRGGRRRPMLLRRLGHARHESISQARARVDVLGARRHRGPGADQVARLNVRLIAGREMLAHRAILLRIDGSERVGTRQIVELLAGDAAHRPTSSLRVASTVDKGAAALPASESRSLASPSRRRPAAVPAATPVTSATSR